MLHYCFIFCLYMMNKMSKILISACLLGEKVRYDGKDNLQTHQRLQSWVKAGLVLMICPEMAGGLPTPRPASEIQPQRSASDVLQGKAKTLNVKGDDVTAEYVTGAHKALVLAQKNNIKVAILKARSPSCGARQIYDGSFSGKLVDGQGITAALLLQHGIQVFDEGEIDEALDMAESLT